MAKLRNTSKDVVLIYDRECPACDFYCRRAEVDGAVGTLRRINARKPSQVMTEITQAGLDIDQGMVLKKDGVLYYGSEAIHQLARIAPRHGAFNALNRAMFATQPAAQALYPILRACRNLLLKFLRKTKINNLGASSNDRF